MMSLSKLIWAMIAGSAAAHACTIVSAITQVGPDFRVKVEDRGHPVKRLRIKIEGGAAVTDENGTAVFHGVRPGSNFVMLDTVAGIAEGTGLTVTSDGPTDVTISLKWPSIAPMSARSLKGTLRGADFVPGQPQRRFTLDLFDVTSQRKLQTTQTDERGEFDFENSTPGLYVINVASGTMVVEVDNRSPAAVLDLDMGSTSCGTFFTDRNKCRTSNFQTDRLSGRVLDPSGASVGNATIDLADAAGKAVERLTSDPEGNFASSRNLTGTYELLVRMPGFTPYRGKVRLEPVNEPAQTGPLTIPLGLMGMCWSPEKP